MSFRRVSIFSFFLLLCLIGNSFEAHAFRDRCPRHQTITEFKTKLAKTRLFRGSIDDFNAYLNNHDRSQGTVLAFVEQDEIFVESEFEFDFVHAGGGLMCVVLKKIKSYFYAAPKIYMPTDYKKKSCEYKHILKHEKRHLQAVYDFHEANSGAYQRYLGHIVRDMPIFSPVGTKAELEKNQQTIAQYFNNKFSEQVQKSYIELNKIQQKIDSPQEYIGVGKRLDRCKMEELKNQNKKTFYESALQ